MERKRRFMTSACLFSKFLRGVVLTRSEREYVDSRQPSGMHGTFCFYKPLRQVKVSTMKYIDRTSKWAKKFLCLSF